MKTINVNGNEVVMYASIKELPIDISKKFQAYLLQDMGIGNSVEDMDNHFAKLMAFLSSNKKEEAMEEAKNLRYNLFSMLSGWDFKALSFACLVANINGVETTDYTIEGLNDLLKKLSDYGLTIGQVHEIVEEVKKNLLPSVAYTSLNTLGMI